MATETPNASSLFTFEPSDIRLKVTYKGEIITAHVSSSAMCFASPVWKKFIFPPWKPVAAKSQAVDTALDLDHVAKKSKIASSDQKDSTVGLPVEEVDFKDDDGEALLILLPIAHLRFQDNPATLPYETLLQVAVLCDQYQCINLVKPWLPQWLVDEIECSLKVGHENWLFMAWVFGREKIFAALAFMIVQRVKVDPATKELWMTSFNSGSKYKILEPMPDRILGKCILQVRTEVVGLILDTAYSLVDSYLHYGKSLCCSDKHNARSEECGAILLGSLLRGLQKLRILPKTAANKANTKTDHMSVDELMEGLNNIRIKALHSMCSNSSPFNIDIKDYLSAFHGLVIEYHTRHMKQQSGEEN